MRSSKHLTRGMALVYLSIMMVVLVGFASLAVDVGTAQVAKTQARVAADAAALYAANSLITGTVSSVQTAAVTAAAANNINGSPAVVNSSQDVQFGIWDPSTRTFTALSSPNQLGANAISVTVHCTKARGNAIPLSFAGIIGFSSVDVSATSIATIGTVSESTVPAAACPWLAGMPAGSTVPATNGNPTPANTTSNTPIEVGTSGGTQIHFAAVGGNTSWANTNGSGTSSTAGAAGDPTFIAGQAACNGINTTTAPLNCLVGIFLNGNAPNTTAMAASLDFSTSTERNYTTLSPQLKQVFYIGNGTDSAGNLQTVVAPAGATRLFLGTIDEYGWWWDNVGSLNLTVAQGNSAVLVQ